MYSDAEIFAFVAGMADNPLQTSLVLAGLTLLLLLIRLGDSRPAPLLFRFIVLIAVIPTTLVALAGVATVKPALVAGLLATMVLAGDEAVYHLLVYFNSNGLK